MTRVLTVNAGSTSLKLERYSLAQPVADIADPPNAAYTAEPDVAIDDDAARDAALREALGEGVDAVAHRFVQLPDGLPPAFVLDEAMLARIRSVAAQDPLHDAAALRGVASIGRIAPETAQFGISDSAFHRTMPDAAKTYALPRELVRDGLHRVGYHGLSHEYAAHRGCRLASLDVTRARVVTAHLGGGSSLCAVRDGASIDTTMGYSALEGVPMATRSGSVDPGVLVRLLRAGMSVDDLENVLERKSGLLGISGRSGDLRELDSAAGSGDVNARLALDVLAWRVRAAFGAMIAVLGGVDLITFAGGIGEHAAAMRAAILDGGLGAGAQLDAARNGGSREGRIDGAGSNVAIAIVNAREGWQMARLTAAL